MPIPERWKSLATNALLALTTTTLTLFAIELLLWMTPYRSKIPLLAEPRNYWVNHAETGYDIGKNVPKDTHHFFDAEVDVWSNELSCFDTPYTNSEPTIYLTGDSFAWGFGDFADKWGTIIQNTTGRRVLKCGVGGFGTKQELIKTTNHFETLSPKPSVLIVGYLGANDVEDDALFPNYTVDHGYRVRDARLTQDKGVAYAVKRWFTIHSALYNLVKNNARPLIIGLLPDSWLERSGIAPATKAAVDTESEAAYTEHLQNVLGFKSLAEKHGAKLLFVLIPSRNELRQSGSAHNNQRLKPFLEANDIPFIDLFPALQAAEQSGTKLYWDVDGHWNNAGNRFVGELVSDHLVHEQFVPKSASFIDRAPIDE
jgi:hypothetical protein